MALRSALRHPVRSARPWPNDSPSTCLAPEQYFPTEHLLSPTNVRAEVDSHNRLARGFGDLRSVPEVRSEENEGRRLPRDCSARPNAASPIRYMQSVSLAFAGSFRTHSEPAVRVARRRSK